MVKYYIKGMDASPPDRYVEPPSYVYRNAVDVVVIDSNELIGTFTGLYNEAGSKYYRVPNPIGFGRD